MTSYPPFFMSADSVIFGLSESALSVLLIQRAIPPFEGGWALPGGHVEIAEDLAPAAVRELREETGLAGGPLVQLGAFGAPDRDPRKRMVTVAYVGAVLVREAVVEGADDAAAARFFPINDLPPLAFDHALIIEQARLRLGFCRPTPHDLPGRPTKAAPPPADPIAHLVLVAGLTAAGKSTFARRLAAAVPRAVWLDAGDTIRLDLTNHAPVFGRAEANWVHEATRALAEHLLARGHDIILDATGLTPDDRGFYLDIAHAFGAATVLAWMQTDEATAAERLARRAAGGDPLDRSTAGADIRARLRPRVLLPTAAEADVFRFVTPETADTTLAELGVRLNALATKQPDAA